MRIVPVLLILALIPASGDAGRAAVPAPSPSALPPALVTAPIGPVGSEDGRIRVLPTSAPIARSFQVLAQGNTSGAMRSFAFKDDQGTAVTHGARVPHLAYLAIPWPTFGLTLYQVLGIERDDIHVAWLYCRGPTTLLGVYHESAQQDPLAWSPADAGSTCVGQPTSAPATSQVALAALDMPYPALVKGFTISGPSIAYDGSGPGRIVLGDATAVLLPFGVVDCSKACGGAGWQELHALLYEPDARRVTFGILYLINGQDGTVRLDHGLRLPDLERVSGTYPATWTIG